MPRLTRPRLLAALCLALLLAAGLSTLARAGGSGIPGLSYREDLNGDSQANVLDVLAMLLSAPGAPRDPRWDYDRDGAWALDDALLLLSALVRHDLTAVSHPAETDETLRNPGRGFISVHSFNDWVLRGIPDHPWCSIAQFRWYWDEIERNEGQVDFAMIDQLIARARANGQKLMLRVMCQNGSRHVPTWVLSAGLKGHSYTDGSQGWQPDYDSAVFLAKHENLIRALAERYDGHPDVDHVDIGSVGQWGEWHTSGTGWPMPADSTQRKIVDIYFRHFKKTPLIMLIGGGPALAYAVAGGSGWRADCFGDMGGFSGDWSHMEDIYQQALDDAEANHAWQQAPVIFETCWTMKFWYARGWDIDHILAEGLRWHVTAMNNGSDTIPAAWADKVREYEKKMGYRFVLRELEHGALAHPGDSLALRMKWANRGVAPIYLRHPLAFQLRSERDTTVAFVLESAADITGWLPGEVELATTVAVPPGIPPGDYELGVGMLDPHSHQPRIMFAIANRDPDLWHRVSRVRVR